MTERERLILEKLAQVLPYMPDSAKERLIGYGDCLADILRQNKADSQSVTAARTAR